MKFLVGRLCAASMSFAGIAAAGEPAPIADYLFVGSHHMNNPGRDVHNTRADDVLSSRRQREIAEVVRLLERYRPTRIMIERESGKQADVDAQYADTCSGKRAYTRREDKQIGFRLACRSKLPAPVAVDWSESGPITDEDSIHYPKAIEKYGQHSQRAADLAIGEAASRQEQAILDRGSVLDMLRHLNAQAWLAANARSYHRVAQYGAPADPVGANWEAL